MSIRLWPRTRKPRPRPHGPLCREWHRGSSTAALLTWGDCAHDSCWAIAIGRCA